MMQPSVLAAPASSSCGSHCRRLPTGRGRQQPSPAAASPASTHFRSSLLHSTRSRLPHSHCRAAPPNVDNKQLDSETARKKFQKMVYQRPASPDCLPASPSDPPLSPTHLSLSTASSGAPHARLSSSPERELKRSRQQQQQPSSSAAAASVATSSSSSSSSSSIQYQQQQLELLHMQPSFPEVQPHAQPPPRTEDTNTNTAAAVHTPPTLHTPQRTSPAHSQQSTEDTNTNTRHATSTASTSYSRSDSSTRSVAGSVDEGLTAPDHAAANRTVNSPPAAATAMEEEEVGGFGGVPKSVLVVSCVSAALTMSSCVFNTLLPIYMVSELKMSMHSMGMFEGAMEAFSYIVRMFSGVVSDMMTSRKAAITLGFAMGASAKFGMSGASTVTQLFTAKAIDRLANGVQAAPRDALISDLSPAATRSACFGFAQSLRKWGSALGASMVFFLMKATNNNYQAIFMLAAGISTLSCIAFVLLVPNHVRPQAKAKDGAEGFKLSRLAKDVVQMGSDFYRMLAVIGAYTMCHINESMLEARAMEVGFGKAESSLVVAILAAAIFLMAYPLGRLDDRFGPRFTLAVGVGSLVLGNLTLLLSAQYPYAVFASLFFLGAHWAIVQGPMLAIVAGFAPKHLRGTAFGIFYSMMAVTAIGSNTLFGSVWTAFSAQHAFLLSGSMALLLLLGLPYLLPPSTRRGVPAIA